MMLSVRCAEVEAPALSARLSRRGVMEGAFKRICTRLCIVLLVFSTSVAFARDPEPTHILLESIGYQNILPELLRSGASALTVHFVDEDHLLVSFAVRRLMKRDEVQTPDDEDRTIGAFLVELPAGKVLAHTEWRVHDRGQYLWSLGHGRFVLREKDHLSLLEPTLLAGPQEVFHEYPFLRTDRRILAIQISAENDLLTLETTDRPLVDAVKVHLFDAASPQNTTPVQINFYRLHSEGPGPEKLRIASAGVLKTHVALALPVTTGGFLNVVDGGHGRWLFDFDRHTGKVDELAEFNTTCYPRTTFVSHSEFVAFGCRGSSDKQMIGGFDLKGEEMWQQNFFDTHIAPTFSFAPEAGRFALERTIVALGSGTELSASVAPGSVTGQEVRVYQMHTGKLLFKIDCSPIERAGQNFALSPAGMRLAVIRETVTQHKATKVDEAYTVRTAAIDVFPLPALTGKDEAAVKEMAGIAPEDTGIRVDQVFTRISGQAAANVAPSAAETAPDLSPPTTPPVADSAQPAAATASGDAEPTAPRKPPTLYGPGETPDGKPPR